ncbi:MAG: diguanylate cyclase [Acidimicrobiales bacterium]
MEPVRPEPAVDLGDRAAVQAMLDAVRAFGASPLAAGADGRGDGPPSPAATPSATPVDTGADTAPLERRDPTSSGPSAERWFATGGSSGLGRAVKGGHAVMFAAVALVVIGQFAVDGRPAWLGLIATIGNAAPVFLLAARALTYRESRRAWWCIVAALGLQLWGALFAFALGDVAAVGSGAGWRDVFALPALVTLGAAVFLLTQTSLGRVHPSVRLDGLTVGLGAACVATGLFGRALLGGTGDWSLTVTLLYPLGDLILVVMLLAGLAPRRYRPTWSSGLLMAAVGIVAVGDVLRVYQDQRGGPGDGRPWYEVTSLTGYAVMALAAWAPGRYRRPVRSVAMHDRHLAIPAVSALAALVVLICVPVFELPPLTTALAGGTIGLALTRTLWTARDLTRLTERARSAHTDELTQLPNRRAFFDQLDRRLVAPMVRHAVLVVDLDGFKGINDTYGHAAGDELLRCVAQRMRARLPEQVAFARMGGDEFCAVAPVNSPEEAMLIGRTITAALTEPFRLEAAVVNVGASCGVSLQPEHGANRVELLHAADVAMYDAKRHRKGVVLFQASQEPAPLTEADLVDDVRLGLAEGRAEVHFQPIARCEDGRLCGLEALARFRHPQRGLLAGAELLPLVEQGGVEAELFSVVLQSSVQFASALFRQGMPVPVTINVGAQSLRQPSTIHEVNDALAAAGLPASMLTIETSEATLALDPLLFAHALATFRRMGINVVIDHFTGSAACLDALEVGAVTGVKVGASLTESIAQHTNGYVLLHGLTTVAAHFGLCIGVVGAWDVTALRALAEAGIGTAQGFAIAEPQHPHELLRRFADFAAESTELLVRR